MNCFFSHLAQNGDTWCVFTNLVAKYRFPVNCVLLLVGVLLLVLSCVVCNCCWLAVCIVVVVLCVLLSYVYLLYYVCIALIFYFRCRNAG